ncbi:MAG: TlpA disulfide reductase family protein [Bacteroidota bacterium]
MKNLIKIFTLLLALAITGCGGNKADENSFVIKGNLTNTKKDSIYLDELTVKEMIPVDSAVITEDGDFYFKVKPKEIGFYVLRMKSDNFVTLLIDKGETVDISADSRQLTQTYQVSGSVGSEQIWELNMHKKENYAKVDSLKVEYDESKDKPDILEIKNALDSTYKLIFYDEKEFAKKFIDKNTSSLACLIAIYEQFGREALFFEKDSADFSYFEKLDKALMAAYPGNLHVEDLHSRVSEIKRLKAELALAESKLSVGSDAPEFSLETPEGTSVSLSSLEGKYVLIDFWASWCAPCRINNPNLVALYKKYMNSNFTILGVSLDRENDSWTAAIKKDKLTWTQVSDLKYWSSPIAKLYNVQEIPYMVLVDKEGKILAKSTDLTVIEEKIEEVLK